MFDPHFHFNSNLNIIISIRIFFSKLIQLIKQPFIILGFNVNLKNLTNLEKSIIKKYYSSSLNKFSPIGQTIPLNNSEIISVVYNLCSRNILIPLSDYEIMDKYTGQGVVYEMNPYAANKLNRKKVNLK